MQDLKTHKDTILVGPNGMRSVHFGADYIFCNRHDSDAAIQWAIDEFYKHHEGNFKRDGLNKPTVENYKMGRTWGVKLSGGFDMDYIQRTIRQILSSKAVA